MDNEIRIPEAERDFLEEIVELVNLHRLDSDFVGKLQEYHPFDIARALAAVESSVRAETFRLLPVAFAAKLFESFEEEDAIGYIRELPPALAVSIIDLMETDEALDLMQYLESEEEDTTLVNLLSPKKREELKKYWNYTEDQVGSIMSTSYIEIPVSMSVKDAMRKVTAIAGDTDYISILFIVDKQKLVGILRLKQLISARQGDSMADIMETRYPSAHPEDDKEAVARLWQDYGESSLPVLDKDGKMAGIVTYDVMMDVISEVQSEDYGKLAGLGEAAIEDQSENVFASVKSRLPWLALQLFLSMISSLVLSLYEGILSTDVLLAARLAIFMPLILDMSGNIGTQSLAVTIRYLVSNQNELPREMIRRHLRRELVSGILEGVLIGLVTYGFIYVSSLLRTEFSTGSAFAFVTAFSISVSLAVSNILGALLPLLMVRLKKDPAVASGPFITTVADLIALLVYYSLSLALLFGLN